MKTERRRPRRSSGQPCLRVRQSGRGHESTIEGSDESGMEEVGVKRMRRKGEFSRGRREGEEGEGGVWEEREGERREEEEEEKAKGTDGPFKSRADPSEQEEKEERRGQRRAEAGGLSSKGTGLDAVGRGRGRAGGERATARRRCSVSSLGAPVHARWGKRQGTGRVRRPAGGGKAECALFSTSKGVGRLAGGRSRPGHPGSINLSDRFQSRAGAPSILSGSA
ncbi:hypothetical protein VTN00DRAFT_121 [Thermoascus crustaceus]|uniref:uncharacterized protein n=1 Tax=Thermoascus crustaceus TaxID=5088 RepID=UPI0037434EF3